jgi:tetratricopeptide (TPR) repeat protein
MASARLTALLLAIVTCTTAVRGSAPIKVYPGAGRNREAMRIENEAEAQLANGDFEKAKQSVDNALRIDPAFWPALFTRAKLFAGEGRLELALRDCNELMRLHPTFIPAALLRVRTNVWLHNYSAALGEIDHVLSIQPRSNDYARALQERARLRATCPDPVFRNGQQSIKDATEACTITSWRDEGMIDVLATAYAEAGDWDSALRYEEKALAVKGISASASKLLQEHLLCFRQHGRIRSSK